MGATETAVETNAQSRPPTSVKGRLSIIGPGLIMAATGVGAGDMVSSLVAGTRYGFTLLWAIVIGAIFKYALTEGVGRWHLASGLTPLQGIRSLGRIASGYFAVYLVIFGFVYGAAVSAATGLATNAMFPGISVQWWSVIVAIIGFAILMIGRYGVFERVMEAFVLLMFVTIVGSAILTAPNLANLGRGMTFHLPGGSLLYVLGLVGGVGGTITLASYAYWLRDKGWRGKAWMTSMRVDLVVGYVVTPIFTVSMMIIGAQFLFGTGKTISGSGGLVALASPFGERFGEAARWMFLIGFFAATFTSLIGGFNGIAYMFSDLMRIAKHVPEDQAEQYTSARSRMFRLFLVWTTFPPMLLHLFGEPVLLVIIYSAFGALFMPFLAVILLTLLNSKRVEKRYRNGPLSNIVLGLSLVLFAFLAVHEIVGLF